MAPHQETPARATYEDLVAAPDHLVAELIDGELFTSPRPAPRHAMASSRLGAILSPPFDMGRGGPGGWRILDEPELHLGADVLVPDLAGGAANGCLRCQKKRTSSLRRTGSARSSPPRPLRWIA